MPEMSDELRVASRLGDTTRLKGILDRWRSDRNTRTPLIETTGYGKTALHFACEGHNPVGGLKAVQFIVKEHPTLLELPQYDGWTVLHAACEGGSLPIVQFLVIKHRKLLQLTTINMLTVLHVACLYGHRPVAEWLVDQCPELLAYTDNQGKTALYFACQEGHLPLAKTLVNKHPALLGQTTQDGWTLLHVVCLGAHRVVAVWLIDQGLDLEAKDRWDNTPIDVAQNVGHSDFATWLREQSRRPAQASIPPTPDATASGGRTLAEMQATITRLQRELTIAQWAASTATSRGTWTPFTFRPAAAAPAPAFATPSAPRFNFGPTSSATPAFAFGTPPTPGFTFSPAAAAPASATPPAPGFNFGPTAAAAPAPASAAPGFTFGPTAAAASAPASTSTSTSAPTRVPQPQ